MSCFLCKSLKFPLSGVAQVLKFLHPLPKQKRRNPLSQSHELFWKIFWQCGRTHMVQLGPQAPHPCPPFSAHFFYPLRKASEVEPPVCRHTQMQGSRTPTTAAPHRPPPSASHSGPRAARGGVGMPPESRRPPARRQSQLPAQLRHGVGGAGPPRRGPRVPQAVAPALGGGCPPPRAIVQFEAVPVT